MTPRGDGRVPLARADRARRAQHLRLALAFAGAGWIAAVSPAALALSPPVHGEPFPPIVVRAWSEGRLRPAQRATDLRAATGVGAEAAPGRLDDGAGSGAPANDGAAAPNATIGRWNVPVLLIDFPDRPATYAASAFARLLFDTTANVPTGSLAEYYTEVSGGLLTVRGDVYGWRTMPDTANFYANDSYGLARTTAPQNDAGLLYAALKAYDADVDFSRYDRNADGFVDAVLVLHSGVGAEAASGDRSQFWSITSSLFGNWGYAQTYVTKDPRPGHPGQFMKVDQFSILAETSPIHAGAIGEIGVWCHEFGHDLGWPDLYDASTLGGGINLGAGNWCLMATGGFGGDSQSPERPTQPCGWAKLDAGWVTQVNLDVDGDRTFLPIETSRNVYRLWYQGEDSDEFYLLENRQRVGFDGGLPGEGLLVTRIRRDVIAQRRAANNINSGFISGLRVEEADGRADLRNTVNRGDARDPFPGSLGRTRFADDTTPSTRTLDGRPLKTSLEAIRNQGDDVSAYVQLLPTGWSAPLDVGATGPSAALPVNGRSPLAVDAFGDLWLVYEDDKGAGSEVWLRRKRFGVEWTTPAALTADPGLSLSPTIVIGNDGRKAVAWWDTRDGNSEIYYAWATPQGELGAPRRVTNQPAASQLPAACWRQDGRLTLAWMDGRADGTCIFARTFLPGLEASASDVRVSKPEPLIVLGNSAVPTLAAAGNRVVLAFQERIGGVDEIMACVDSGGRFTEPIYLSLKDGFTSNQPVLVTESDTSVWIFWRENGPQGSEIRQGRWSYRMGWNLGFVSYKSPQTLDLPRPAMDPAGELHLLFRRAGTSGIELVEATFDPATRLWDAGPSRLVVLGAEQIAGTAFVFDLVGRTHVLWLGVTAGERRFRELVRAGPVVAPVAVTAVAAAPPNGLAFAWPNPARGSAALFVRSAHARPPGTRAVLYSVAGRRLATIDAAGDEDGSVRWDGRDAGGQGVPPGIILVRIVSPDGAAIADGRFVWLP